MVVSLAWSFFSPLIHRLAWLSFSSFFHDCPHTAILCFYTIIFSSSYHIPPVPCRHTGTKYTGEPTIGAPTLLPLW
ncbi:hypothetical protein DL89DRAFT_18704 [Linderina pennispora]|uniref:Secreted protein n=1 Tax=Linderina pennispora TaxID=61395 RepID=A0A1Y1WLV7_9FUNG|nr:uncharacterized protein DL89DRAFT_18704 [Linderina pennispora]ORX74550.1 hypothetical protein DL89DRAFT_18704 [Linderina pennispora]